MLSLLATKLYVKPDNQRAPWFHNSEDIVKALSNLGIKFNNFGIEKWISSVFILTSVAEKHYLQLFCVAAFVIVFPILRAFIPFFFFRCWTYGMTVKNTHNRFKWVTL